MSAGPVAGLAPLGRVLIVEDNAALRVAMRDTLRDLGYEVITAATGRAGLHELETQEPALMVTDLRLPELDGIDLLRAVREKGLDTAVLMITAFASVGTAVEALRLGALDYVTKPFPMEKLSHAVDSFFRSRRIEEQHAELQRRVADLDGLGHMVGTSQPMLALYELLRTVAPTDSTVLITGESGTGKELVANTLRDLSRRAAQPFVKVHCASLPRTLIEAELFGHERGAFTGATRQMKGRFELAHKGTLFLDEIDEIPLEIQVKLLRTLQEREVERVGGRQPIPVDVRIVAATKVDLAELVAEGQFREDLYYRVNVVNLRLPPLRERREDLPLLAEHFLRVMERKLDRKLAGFEPDALEALERFSYPGNVRQLAHAIESAAILAGAGQIGRRHLPEPFRSEPPAEVCPCGGVPSDLPLAEALRRFEREYLAVALQAHDGTRLDLAQRLGISRKSLWEKLKQYGLG